MSQWTLGLTALTVFEKGRTLKELWTHNRPLGSQVAGECSAQPKEASTWQCSPGVKTSRPACWAQILPLCTPVWPQTSYTTPLLLGFCRWKIKIIVVLSLALLCGISEFMPGKFHSHKYGGAGMGIGAASGDWTRWSLYSVIFLTFANPNPHEDICRCP